MLNTFAFVYSNQTWRIESNLISFDLAIGSICVYFFFFFFFHLRRVKCNRLSTSSNVIGWKKTKQNKTKKRKLSTKPKPPPPAVAMKAMPRERSPQIHAKTSAALVTVRNEIWFESPLLHVTFFICRKMQRHWTNKASFIQLLAFVAVNARPNYETRYIWDLGDLYIWLKMLTAYGRLHSTSPVKTIHIQVRSNKTSLDIGKPFGHFLYIEWFDHH